MFMYRIYLMLYREVSKDGGLQKVQVDGQGIAFSLPH